jgi:hypothetical protein
VGREAWRLGTFTDAGSARWALLAAAALLAAGSAASFTIPTIGPGNRAHAEPTGLAGRELAGAVEGLYQS